LQLFEGDRTAAQRWLNEPAKALGGSKPIDYLDTEAGAEAVHDLILRLEHGVIT
jgi:putative toxin-antitoxin system antitoxin component (TIGR02293 family)